MQVDLAGPGVDGDQAEAAAYAEDVDGGVDTAGGSRELAGDIGARVRGPLGDQGTPVRGVPEPASWALMLLGFAGVGVAMRRSRKSKPALMQVA